MNASPRTQRGAALVVGLLLLVVLTLLAIAGMNTASTELVMSGNEQFREGAFQAAETGIERTVAVLDTIPPGSKPVEKTETLSPNTSYTTTTTYRGEGVVPGFSQKFVGYYYDVQSTGRSVRNAASSQTQGAYVINQSGQ